MIRWFLKFLSIGILVLVLLRLAPAIPISSVVTQKQDQFSVSGEGKVTVVPDTAMVDLGVTATSPTVKAAQTRANDTINKISSGIKALGVDATDITTTNYSIYPQYDYSSSSINRINGYQVTVNLSIRVRDIDKINAVIDSATANGANTVGSVQLTVNEDRQKELLQEARELAVKEAKTKAESLAKAAGITLGKIINVQESGPPGYPVPMFDKVMLSEASRGGDTQIETGSTDITSTITLIYETR